MAYGAAGDPENLIQPNTLMPYTGLNDLTVNGRVPQAGVDYAPILPMGGNGGMPMPTLPVAQAPELPGMLPTMDIAPTANPWQTAARMLQGFQSGMMGKPNPVIELEQQQQQIQQQQQRLDQNARALQQEMLLRERSHQLQEKRLVLDEERQKRLETQHLQTMKANLGQTLLASEDEAGVKAGLAILRDTGVFNLPANLEQEFIGSRLAKTYQQRLDAVLQALEVGVDPKTIGVSTAGIDVDKLSAMGPDQRAALASPAYQKNAVELADKRIQMARDRMVQDIKQRAAAGTPVSATEMKIAGINPKNSEEVAAEIVASHYGDPKKPMTPLEQGVVNAFMMKNKLGGITGEAAVAMRAAAGDPEAKKAFALLNEDKRRMTQVDLMMQAGMVRAKMQINPAYEPTLQERAILAAADGFAEQKSAKPMPQYMDKRFQSMRAIGNVMSDIDEALDKGGLANVGPFAGRAGKMAEMIGGPFHDKVRSQLYTAVDTLFAEIGPEKFGGQFTSGEQKIVRDFRAELTSPSGQFQVRHEAFRTLMRNKYEDTVRVAKANKFRVPDDFEDVPSGLTSTKSPQATPREETIKKRTKELLLEGKTKEQVIQQLRKEGFQ